MLGLWLSIIVALMIGLAVDDWLNNNSNGGGGFFA